MRWSRSKAIKNSAMKSVVSETEAADEEDDAPATPDSFPLVVEVVAVEEINR